MSHSKDKADVAAKVASFAVVLVLLLEDAGPPPPPSSHSMSDSPSSRKRRTLIAGIERELLGDLGEDLRSSLLFSIVTLQKTNSGAPLSEAAEAESGPTSFSEAAPLSMEDSSEAATKESEKKHEIPFPSVPI